MEPPLGTGDNKLLEKCSSGKANANSGLPCSEGNAAKVGPASGNLMDTKQNSEVNDERIVEGQQCAISEDGSSVVNVVDTAEEQEDPCMSETLDDDLICENSPLTESNISVEGIPIGSCGLSVSESTIEEKLDCEENSIVVSETNDETVGNAVISDSCLKKNQRKEYEEETDKVHDVTDEIFIENALSKNPLCVVQKELCEDTTEEKDSEGIHKKRVLECDVQKESCKNVGESEILTPHIAESTNRNSKYMRDHAETESTSDIKHDEKDSEYCELSTESNKPIEEGQNSISKDGSGIQKHATQECLMEEERKSAKETGNVVEEAGIAEGKRERAFEGVGNMEEREGTIVEGEECSVERKGNVKESDGSVIVREERAIEITRNAIEEDSVIEGEGDIVEGSGSVVEGEGNIVEGSGSVVEGEGSVEGGRSVVEGEDSIVEGGGSVVEGEDSVVEGEDNIVGREDSVVEGEDNIVGREDSVVERGGSVVEGENSIVEGGGSAVEGEGSAVEGEGSAVEGEGSLEGEGSAIEGEGSAVEGEGSAIEGEGSAIEEEGSAVEGEGSAIEGEGRAVEETESAVQGDGNSVPEDESENHLQESIIVGDESVTENVSSADSTYETANEKTVIDVLDDMQEIGIEGDNENNTDKSTHSTKIQNVKDDNVKEKSDLQLKENMENQSKVIGSEVEAVEQDSSCENVRSLKSSIESEPMVKDDSCNSTDSRVVPISDTNLCDIQSTARNREVDPDDGLSLDTEKSDVEKSSDSGSQLPQNVVLEKDDANEMHPEIGADVDENDDDKYENEMETGCMEKSARTIDNISEDAGINKESEKDNQENSNDAQDAVEFVQIDSDDKDDSSQQSLEGTQEDDLDAEKEKDPIAISNDENNKDDDVVLNNKEQAMEIDDPIQLDKDDFNSSELETSASIETSGNVDISEMCETVLEEPGSYDQSENSPEISRTKQLNTTNRKNYAEDIEILDSSDLVGESVKQGNNKNLSVREKTSINENAQVNVDLPGETITADDEEICIIPDTVPRVITGQTNSQQKIQKTPARKVSDVESVSTIPVDTNKDVKGKSETGKGKKNNKIIETDEKLREKSPEVQKDSNETRRTPGRPQRQAAKRAECQIKELAADEAELQETEERVGGLRVCDHCCKVRSWVTSFKFQENGSDKSKYFCSQDCASNYKRTFRVKPTNDLDASVLESARTFTRKCAQCSLVITGDERNLSWETMDYCNEECLGRYQKILGSQCANCKGIVAATSLGKYCVRFGYDVKQFCCSGCLEEFKKGLKVCSYCQKDISGGSEGFLAPVGDKGQFKDFCTQSCMEKYDQMSNNHPPPVVVQLCAVCNHEKVVSMEVLHKKRESKFCSEPCFAAYRFVNGMITDQCYMCKKFFDKKEVDNYAVYSDETVHSFCSKTCMNVYILANRKIVPCHWCKVKKYNFDMIKRTLSTGQLLLVCSLNCLALYQVGVNAASSKRVKCDMCGVLNSPQYNINMSDNTVRDFCSYQCVLQFQEQYSNSTPHDTPVPTGPPKRYVSQRRSVPAQQNDTRSDNVSGAKTGSSVALPVIASVQSLASDDSPAQNSSGITTRSATTLKSNSNNNNNNVTQTAVQPPKVVRQIIVRPPPPKQMRNKAVTCRPPSHTKGTHCRPIVCTKETQTDTPMAKPVLIPVPVPIYVPTPMCLYSSPFPVPVPFPLPVPVPVFIPTTRNSAKGIMKEIKRIQEKIPADPFEAELLMMAEIVAGEKKDDNSDSDSDVVDNTEGGTNAADDAAEATAANAPADETYAPETVDTSNTFGDDMLQMALKMATELEEPTDLEAALTPSTITPQPPASVEQTNSESEDDPEPVQPVPDVRPTRGRKRPVRSLRTSTTTTTAASTNSKRRRVSNTGDAPLLPPPEPTPPVQVEQEKPDANMCLKYTLGVNAWKRWVLTKNAELEKAAASNRKLKLFKTEILQQTADELNYSLCLFVKEVRKPNGQEYAPDTIYYLCLGIQQYLFENGRIDNIFTDPYYEKFTECLDEVAKKFSTLYNDSQYIVTRVEEEHLWESKQLGAHSPHVLLSTLMFFNTKHFNLTTVEEHMQLSFSHIMKHWKRNSGQSGSSKGPGSSRNVLLRFYPPQSALDANSKKKKVYEQQENEENPLRCPVKLYEFYLSKCPESVKTRNDVFYLLPERSCVPDSPVWYSTMALGKEPLMKMLHRVKMVKEINQALLKS